MAERENRMAKMKLSGQAEMWLYRESPEIWAVTRVLMHSPKYKELLWKALDSAEKEVIRKAVDMSKK